MFFAIYFCPGFISAYNFAVMYTFPYYFINRVYFVGKAAEQIMYAALADIDIKNIVEHFLHPGKWHILPCIKISDKPFDVRAITYGGIYPIGKIRDSCVPTFTFFTVYLIFCKYGFNRRYVQYLAAFFFLPHYTVELIS